MCVINAVWQKTKIKQLMLDRVVDLILTSHIVLDQKQIKKFCISQS